MELNISTRDNTIYILHYDKQLMAMQHFEETLTYISQLLDITVCRLIR